MQPDGDKDDRANDVGATFFCGGVCGWAAESSSWVGIQNLVVLFGSQQQAVVLFSHLCVCYSHGRAFVTMPTQRAFLLCRILTVHAVSRAKHTLLVCNAYAGEVPPCTYVSETRQQRPTRTHDLSFGCGLLNLSHLVAAEETILSHSLPPYISSCALAAPAACPKIKINPPARARGHARGRR